MTAYEGHQVETLAEVRAQLEAARAENARVAGLLTAMVPLLKDAHEAARDLHCRLDRPLNLQQSLVLRRCARTLRDGIDGARTILRNELLKKGAARP